VGDEANMPFAAGGGISNLSQIRQIIMAGAEKVVINTTAVENPVFIRNASNEFGSSAIVVSIDVKKKFLGKQQVFIRGGQKASGLDPVDFARQMEDMGAGEIILTSVDREGLMQGYDMDLLRRVSEAVTIPVVANGGAKTLQHMRDAIDIASASAAAAGSLFVYHGPRKAVLINYPTREELKTLFQVEISH
jgi:cyclase